MLPPILSALLTVKKRKADSGGVSEVTGEYGDIRANEGKELERQGEEGVVIGHIYTCW